MLFFDWMIWATVGTAIVLGAETPSESLSDGVHVPSQQEAFAEGYAKGREDALADHTARVTRLRVLRQLNRAAARPSRPLMAELMDAHPFTVGAPFLGPQGPAYDSVSQGISWVHHQLEEWFE